MSQTSHDGDRTQKDSKAVSLPPAHIPSFRDLATEHRLVLKTAPKGYSLRENAEQLSRMIRPHDYSPRPATVRDKDLVPTPEESLRLIKARATASAEGVIQFDAELRPVNPIGPTGLCGKGALWNWGPNHAADGLIVSRGDHGDHKFLAIKRPCGTWAIPGGFLDSKENSRQAALRELGEEAVRESEKLSKLFLSNAQLLYRGYADDPRNTDNAWIETAVYLLIIDQAFATSLLKRSAKETSGEVKEVSWISLHDELANRLYSSHSDYIELARARLAA